MGTPRQKRQSGNWRAPPLPRQSGNFKRLYLVVAARSGELEPVESVVECEDLVVLLYDRVLSPQALLQQENESEIPASETRNEIFSAGFV